MPLGFDTRALSVQLLELTLQHRTLRANPGGNLQRDLHALPILAPKPTGVFAVAGVVVDSSGEPAYLGSPGSLQQMAFPEHWAPVVRAAQGIFADGWAEHDGVPEIILEGFHLAKSAGIPVFFDPGPGNPDVDSAWMAEAVRLTTVLLLNAEEAYQLTGNSDPLQAGRELLARGPEMVILKQGGDGCLIFKRDEALHFDAYPVHVRDTTGAGDSVAGAVIYAYLNGFTSEQIGHLVNLTGGAKVLDMSQS